MRPLHIAVAILIAANWGFNFTVIRLGLDGLPPFLLNSMRFALAATPVLFLPRPAMPWRSMIAIAAAIFFGQFTFLLTGMTLGLPPGLASIVLQTQAFFTIALAALLLRERPTARQLIGLAVAFGGLALIGSTVTGGPGELSVAGLLLCLVAALSWATGNLLLRRAPATELLPLVAWLSLIVAGPFFILSLIFEGRDAISTALAQLDLVRVGAVLYLAFVATITGYSLWGLLLRNYPASTVAPFSLLVPVFGMASAALVIGEQFGPLRFGGAALLLIGLAIIVIAPRKPA
jgi:O-acetylserine/cysteine efflux transporter